MGTNFRDKDGMTSLHVGVRVVAFAAVVGMITLAAGRWTAMPDELAAEQQSALAQAESAAVSAPAPAYLIGNGSTARDPSVPPDADVISTAKDVAASPTF